MKHAAIILSILLVASCEREERGFRVQTPDANRINSKQLTTLQAGETSPPPVIENEYEKNAFAMSEGKRLFSQMNCTGCHANGGGGAIGPALTDDKWIYGSEPDHIFATIVEGRPNGMPAFHGKLPDYEVWQIAAYVRSLSGNVSNDAAPGRNDDMQIGKPENSKKKEQPKNLSSPK
jgi:cytochrome c oxidase cbb3-type subunit 3